MAASGKEMKGKHLRKNKEKQILQERDGVLQKHVGLNNWNNCSEMFWKIDVLEFP